MASSGLLPSVPSKAFCWWILVLGCAGDYPLAPTYCDDWCRIEVEACQSSPARCVRSCESERASPACAEAEVDILTCRQQRPADSRCGLVGFPNTCEPQIDALTSCEEELRLTSCTAHCRDSREKFPLGATSLLAQFICAAPDISCAAACVDLSLFARGGGCASDTNNRIGSDRGFGALKGPSPCFEGLVAECFPTAL